MLIRVKYPDGKYDMVKEFRLDFLIQTKSLHSFKRSNGWAVLGIDPVRQTSGQRRSNAPERRQSLMPVAATA